MLDAPLMMRKGLALVSMIVEKFMFRLYTHPWPPSGKYTDSISFESLLTRIVMHVHPALVSVGEVGE